MLSASLVLLGLLAAAAPLIARRLGRDAGYVLAGGLAVAGALIAVRAPAALRGEEVTEALPWAPSIGLSMSLRLDALALLFVLLILGVGVLVMAYTARYLHEAGARLYTLLAFFAAAMMGLVLADDIIAMFVFWELTSICSFLLIAGDGLAGRQPAKRAFLITSAGGLALFGGVLLLAVVTGTFELSEILAAREQVEAYPGIALAAAVLIALGAFTKSAQFPFHFWLPGAMVAPTPVSTYLHAATMVKAGIYVLARMSPLFTGTPPWTVMLLTVGLVTAVLTAVLALKATDLKALLAYSTTSMLGFIVALIGVGSFEALAAAGLLTLTHAAYKATLFMVAGIVDHEAGTRDIRQLSGLRHVMPGTAVVAGLAAASMAGIPPFLGFVGKEEAYTAFLHIGRAPGIVVIFAAVLTALATLGYSWRFWHGTFAGDLEGDVHTPSWSFVAPPAVSAAVGILLGFAVPILDPLVGNFASLASGEEGDVHLALWHGIKLPLVLSVGTYLVGYLLFVRSRPVERALLGLSTPVRGVGAFDGLYDASLRLGQRIGDPFVPNAPARYLGWVMVSGAVAVGAAAWMVREDLSMQAIPQTTGDVVIAVLLGGALMGLTLARDRLAAVALLGVVGFLVAGFYVLVGAPDLALTQLLIETLTVVLVVLVFRRLPRHFARAGATRRRLAAGAGLLAGVTAALVAATFTGQRGESEVARYYLEAAEPGTGGTNVVNTILVDFRALDTFGEITVLGMAAVGVFTLSRLARQRAAQQPPPSREGDR